jgi:pimeloyl-ACP methyl ester carboxylesterase
MTEQQTMETPQGRRLAFHRTTGAGPGVIFLGGFRSDMTGSKATFLEDWASDRGRSYVRFDYSGHGASEGRFEDGTIGRWAEDARAVLEGCDGPQVLVGSSMGAWIALLIAREMPERVHALVLVAAAPDFTEDGFWADLSDILRAKLMREGRVAVPSDYGDPYMVTKALIEDGRSHLVLRDPLPLPMPVRMFRGTRDAAVSEAQTLRLMRHADAPDLVLTIAKGSDHSFSAPADLLRIAMALEEVS